MSEVRVDDASLAAEADALAAEFQAPPVAAEPVQPGTDVAPSQASPEEVEQGYKLITYAVIERGAAVLAPAWNVTADENDRLSTSIARALVLWFPDQPIPPKYLALLVIAGTAAEIVNARKDPATGQLRPRFHEQRKTEARPASAAASS